MTLKKRILFFFSSLLFTIGILFIGFIALEFTSRIVFPVSPGSFFTDLKGNKIDVYGSEDRFIPGVVFRQISPDFNSIVSIGKHGFRGKIPNSSPEIIFLGDSFTFGQGLNEKETFASIFCIETNKSCVNLAIPGTGTYRQVKILQRELNRYDWSPKEVKLFIFAMSSSLMSGNDLLDTAIEEKMSVDPIAKLDSISSSHQKTNPAFSPLVWLVNKRSLILEKSNLTRIIYSYFGPNLRYWFSPDAKKTQVDQGLKSMSRELEVLAKLGIEKNFDITIYLLHPVQDILGGTYDKTEKIINLAVGSLNFKRTAYIFLDKPSIYYFPYDGHLNKKGAQRIAKLLIEEFNK